MNGNNKIPKIIHYCWFGKKNKPDIVIKCINSWEKHLPDYVIKEWNEDNFNIESNRYIKEAYEARKYAFVSDYARVKTLHEFGGIYLDTDVEVFKSFNDLLHHESFWGFEQENYIATSTIGSVKGNKLIKTFLDLYSNKSFIKADGSFDQLTNVAMITEMLKECGLKMNGEFQELDGLGVFYPQSFFSPFDYINYRKHITENTYALHHFHKSWLPPKERWKGNIKWVVSRVIGGENIARVRKFL